MSFPRYPKYKASGEKWIKDVPEHWEIKPNKSFLTLRKSEVGSTWSQKTLLSLTLHGVISRDMESGKGKFPSDFSSYQDVDENDLIFCLFDMDETPRTVGLAKSSGMITGAYDVFQCRVLLARPQFILYFYLYIDTFKALRPFYTGLRKVVRPPTFLAIKTPLPPLHEQTIIAEFLDRETGKIDELVEELQRLMELLKEKISSLVLSSVDLANTKRLRFVDVASIISRPVLQQQEVSYTRIGLFNRGRGLFHKDASDMDELGESDFFWIEEGDLIISGQFAWEGAVAMAGKEETGCVVSHRYPILRGIPEVALTEYLLGLLCTNHGDFLLNENSRGAAGRNRPLNIRSLMKETIPVPSMQIQETVARAIHSRSVLFQEISNAIDLLQERRTALISAAVTGQIDVRQQARN